MEFVYCEHGHGLPNIEEFDVATGTVIKKGVPLTIAANSKVTKGTANCVGVSAEDHDGTSSMVNPRSNGTKIKAIVSPDAVYKVFGEEFTCAACTSATEIRVSSGLEIGSGLYGRCFAVLVSKTAASTNTDTVGCVRVITDSYNDSSSGEDCLVLNTVSGGIPCSGDKYVLIPGSGKQNLALSSTDDMKLHFTSSGPTLICMGVNTSVANPEKRPCAYVKLAKTVYEIADDD